jgi:hypothetical protein
MLVTTVRTLSFITVGAGMQVCRKVHFFSYVPKRNILMHGLGLTRGCVTVLGWSEKVVLGLPVSLLGLCTCFLCNTALYSPPNRRYINMILDCAAHAVCYEQKGKPIKPVPHEYCKFSQPSDRAALIRLQKRITGFKPNGRKSRRWRRWDVGRCLT